jgi:hypothetical protein
MRDIAEQRCALKAEARNNEGEPETGAGPVNGSCQKCRSWHVALTTVTSTGSVKSGRRGDQCEQGPSCLKTLR